MTRARVCAAGNYDLRIDMEDFEGNQRYAEYKNFKVDDEKVACACACAFILHMD